jgi:transcriptional regulator with XRE-family HTH domain
MEKKTIGSFIAALRKANGMTQRDLAERLNVSDKTVSRWERDDGAPDLSLIPVIAELFEVSCDELLRGERRPPEERTQPDQAEEPSPRGEKQRRRLISASLSQYQNLNLLAAGLSIAGLVAALICNLAFLQGRLGVLVGILFFAASLLCQAVFVNRALLRVEDAALEETALSDYRRRVLSMAKKSAGLTFALLGFTLPLLMAPAYQGIQASSLLLLGLPCAAALLLLYGVALYFLNAALIRRGFLRLSAEEEAVYRHNHRLKRRIALLLGLALVLTLGAHHLLTTLWGPMSIMRGTVFEDYESFIAFMEQDLPAARDIGLASESGWSKDITYYDENGKEISEQEALTRRLEDLDGRVVCEYLERNHQVISIRYIPKSGDILPITVCTESDLAAAQQVVARRHALFAALYLLEALAALLLYNKKRKKLG